MKIKLNVSAHLSSVGKRCRSAAYLVELAFRDAISVVDYACWFEACGFVELDEQLSHHGGQILNDVLTVLLHPNRGTVSTWVGIHTANNLNATKKKMLKAFLETFEAIWSGLKLCTRSQYWPHLWY